MTTCESSSVRHIDSSKKIRSEKSKNPNDNLVDGNCTLAKEPPVVVDTTLSTLTEKPLAVIMNPLSFLNNLLTSN
ncbi:hypothetical protein RN001_016313 [Aquatica leii]|uniref:Uncharacterized protein n=1 Tax=Aquatica leii TaxID=1421715 RepID=A0AAN7SB93_9COLE|nr:hypothetical protein RN001_016313 [Aquatica leii]